MHMWICLKIYRVVYHTSLKHSVIIIILGISFMQGIYTYIPETNHVPREHRVAAILMLLFMVLISLVLTLTPLYSYLYVSTFRSVCAVPNKAVFCSYYYYYYYYYYYFLGISFMQGIYTYIPETNHVPREQCVATILM